jgi:hypothetical protein
MGALLLAAGGVAGCGAATAGSAVVNSSAAISSPVPAMTTPRPPSRPGPGSAGSSAVDPPSVVTTTVTTVTTTGPAAATTPSTPVTTAPAVPPTDLAGEVYGFITAVDVAAGTVTLDKIDWFTGAAAQRACAEDGVTDTNNNRCTGWYFRNRNTALRQVPVAPTASITVLAGGVRDLTGDLPAVAAEVAGYGHAPWRMTVTDGRVTDLKEVYLP